VTLGGDDATYLLLAEALRHGKYVDLFLPFSPPHAQYPPGFPAVIAATQAVAGTNPAVVVAINLALLFTTTLLIANVVRRLVTPRVGVAAGAAVMLNPVMISYAGWALSETLYITLSTAALCMLADVDDESAGLRLWPAAAAGLAAFFTRTVGIAVVLAVLSTGLLRRKWSTAIGAAIVALVLIFAWFTYTSRAADLTLGWSYANDLAYVQPFTRPDALLARMISSAQHYLLVLPPWGFGVPEVPDMPLDNVFWVVSGVALTVAGSRNAWRRWPSVVIYLAGYLGVLLVFPFSVTRLVTPLVPILTVLLALGMTSLAGLVRREVQQDGPALAFLVVVASVGLSRTVSAAAHQRECVASALGSCRTVAEAEWLATVDWIARNIPADAVVASSKPSTLYLVSHRRGVPSRILLGADVSELLAPTGPITHILLSDLWGYERTALSGRLDAVCERLGTIATRWDGTLLLEVLEGHPEEREQPNACQALRRFGTQAADSQVIGRRTADG